MQTVDEGRQDGGTHTTGQGAPHPLATAAWCCLGAAPCNARTSGRSSAPRGYPPAPRSAPFIVRERTAKTAATRRRRRGWPRRRRGEAGRTRAPFPRGLPVLSARGASSPSGTATTRTEARITTQHCSPVHGRDARPVCCARPQQVVVGTARHSRHMPKCPPAQSRACARVAAGTCGQAAARLHRGLCLRAASGRIGPPGDSSAHRSRRTSDLPARRAELRVD